jgi:hypothetical protein
MHSARAWQMWVLPDRDMSHAGRVMLRLGGVKTRHDRGTPLIGSILMRPTPGKHTIELPGGLVASLRTSHEGCNRSSGVPLATR